MNDACPASVLNVRQLKTSVVTPGLVDVVTLTVGSKYGHECRNGVDHQLKLTLGLGAPRFALPQRRVTLRTLDRDARNIRELRDEFLLKRVRASWLALIECKGAQHLSGLRYDRRGPARPQAVRLRERAPRIAPT